MGSFQAIKASTAQSRPDKPGDSPTPDSTHYFGWQVPEAARTRARRLQDISQTEVTPERTLRQMRGETIVFPGMPVMMPEGGVKITAGDNEYARLKKEREDRRRIARENRSHGNRERHGGPIPGAFGKERF